MGCRVLDAGGDGACLYDSVSMTAFGPVFESGDLAEGFLQWVNEDPRVMPAEQLSYKYIEWLGLDEDIREMFVDHYTIGRASE